jgi:hypothetical protein
MGHLSGRPEQWLPAIDPGSGGLFVPLWLAAVIAALLFAFGMVLLGRAGWNGPIEKWSRVGLLLVALAAGWILVAPGGGDRFAAQRGGVDARLAEIAVRASAPGSALACLDGTAGEIVEASCEKALFATPEATAAAVSYVGAQLSLLAEASDYERRSGASYGTALAGVRLAVATDRFGLAAHVLATREACTADRCDFLALLQTPNQVNDNLMAHKYDFLVAQHASEWLQNALTAPGAVAANAPPVAPAPRPPPATPTTPIASAAPATKPNNLFFPSSASIPPISIMAPEPTAPAQPAATAESAPKQPPAPTRKPAASAQPPRRPASTGSTAPAAPAAPAAAASPTSATPLASGHPAAGQPSDN